MAIEQKKLFTPAEMQAVDRLAVESGIDSLALMERAGAAVSAAVLKYWPEIRRAAVLCGPGNNGGDGHIAARHLAACGVPVVRFGHTPRTGTDAALAYAAYPGQILSLGDYQPDAGDVVIDALFGAGLDRPLGRDVATIMERVSLAKIPVLAVDLPSGLNGRTGRPTGACFQANRTITFAGLKPGHVLIPGRQLCGPVEVVDIGIPARLLTSEEQVWINHPALYEEFIPVVDASSHKYLRGHLGVFSGRLISSGAARMAAEAGLRAGAGLVTMACPPGAVLTQASHLTAVMLRPIADRSELEAWLEDLRISAFVLGPGFGDDERAIAYAQAIAEQARGLVLDADGLRAFAENQDLLSELGEKTALVLTPHEGEFQRLFDHLAADDDLSKIERAQMAACSINGVVVYKGADTVIAAPDGRAAVNTDGAAWLATAGSGDVLAGIIGACLVQGMPAFESACAGVALHSMAGMRAGPGMTAEDLIVNVRPYQA